MKKYIITVLALVVGLGLGWVFFAGESPEPKNDNSEETAEFWTCSMHPNVRSQEPGDCPLCGMDLIPAISGGSEVDNSAITLSDNQIRIANISTIKVGSSSTNSFVTLSGKIEIDERKKFTQPSHFSGRVEQLNVNYTGATVSSGQKIASIYSPELVLMQRELLSAYKEKEFNPDLYNSIVRKLKRKKVHDEQIKKIIESGEVEERFDLYSHYSGVVTNLFISNGDHVSMGAPIIELANLNNLWVEFDAYESDLAEVEIGDIIEFEVPAYPNKKFKSRINYIDPLINNDTRTAKVRGSISNSSGLLKPKMLVSGTVNSSSDSETIIIPKSAVLWTGERSIVYVKVPNTDEHIFEAREVKIGKLTDAGYPVLNGLEMGELIATSGAFSIDAAAQIAGKKSMMTMEGGKKKNKKTKHKHKTEKKNSVDLSGMLPNYMELQEAFVDTDLPKAKEIAKKYANYIINNILNSNELKQSDYEQEVESIVDLSKGIAEDNDIEKARKKFSNISVLMIDIIDATKSYNDKLYVMKCPMATVGDSAVWLSKTKKVLNPYYGDKMLNCGFVKREIR
ncbi:MAG: efflux RND transporter periplasmic adaptor subunit [Chlorobiota bacterium]